MATKKQAAAKPAAKPKRRPPRNPKLRRGATKGVKGRQGTLPHIVTDENRRIVESMVATGVQQWLIAEELSISEDTLSRHYRAELDRGYARINGRIGSMVARQALEGCRSSQFFWLKTRAGYRSTDRVEHSGVDGAPIPLAVGPRYDLSSLSKEELRAFEALALKALPAPPDESDA